MLSAHQTTNGYAVTRPLLLSGARLLIFATASLPLLGAAPLTGAPFRVLSENEEPPISPDSPTLWIYLAVAVGLVLLGGAFAGLTIALMGQVSVLYLPTVFCD